jgi:hypothetical protein
MNIIPQDVILIIFNFLNLKDQRRLLRTCHYYFNLTPIVLKNVKYGIYEPS